MEFWDDCVIRKLVTYVISSLNFDGYKEVLAIAASENERSKYWLITSYLLLYINHGLGLLKRVFSPIIILVGSVFIGFRPHTRVKITIVSPTFLNRIPHHCF